MPSGPHRQYVCLGPSSLFCLQGQIQEYRVKPILGLDIYVAPFGRLKKESDQRNGGPTEHSFGLLAQDIEGYGNLCQVSSIGYQGLYYKPQWIMRYYQNSIRILSAYRLVY